MTNDLLMGNAVKFLKLILIIILSLSAGGCSTISSLWEPGRAEASQIDDRRTYQSQIENFNAKESSTNLKIGQSLGFTPPYVPVIQPAEVKKAWIPAHKSESDPDVLVAGHWIYIKIKDDQWFIDTESEESDSFSIIIPTTSSQDIQNGN